jgi:hypothetical protein
MARFYGPKKEFFDKVWKLPDVEKVTEAKWPHANRLEGGRG